MPITGILNLIGGALNRREQRRANERNIAAQKEFAQNSIQWKVEDAKKAGIHPLAALGASGYTASPSFVGDTSMGNAISSAGRAFGQTLQRFYEAEMEDKSEKNRLELENQRLENLKLSKEIAAMGQSPFGGITSALSSGSGPAPSAGAGPHDFTRTIKVDKDVQLSPQANGTFVLGFSPDSLAGQGMSEGTFLGLPVTGWVEMATRFANGGHIRASEAEARKAGYLKEDERFTFYPSPYGLNLVKVKKNSGGSWFERGLRALKKGGVGAHAELTGALARKIKRWLD